eukprot:jgi/Botrbrau1/2273/Bobra.101_2s0096.1
MAENRQLVSNVSKFDDGVAALATLPKPHVVFFTADVDPSSGQAWCPDCARSEEVIRQGVLATGGSILEVQVGPRAVWKDPSHPFRQDPSLKLTGIPTVMLWSDGGPAAILGPELENAASAEEARSLMAAFLEGAAH